MHRVKCCFRKYRPKKLYAYDITHSQTKHLQQYITATAVVARKTNTTQVTSHNLIL